MFETVLYELSGDISAPFHALLRNLRERHGARIVLVCRTREEQPHYEQSGLADIVVPATAMPRRHRDHSKAEILAAAEAAEARLGTRLHYMLIEHRQYFTAAPHFPGGVLNDDYVGWLAYVLDQIAFFDDLMDRHGVTFVLHGKSPVYFAARARGIPVWRLEACLYELRYMWTDRHDPRFPEIVDAYEREPMPQAGDLTAGGIDLKPPSIYYDIRAAIEGAVRLDRLAVGMLREVARHYYYRLRRYEKATRLNFDGWAWAAYLWRQRWQFHLLNRLARRKWADIRDLPYVFFPLSAEPELTLAFWSPEYFEQLSTIQQLAKELPSGVWLVVKEHMISIGNRPSEFYETIARMPNVLLVDPSERGLDIGSTARAVAVIASTAGTEAALQGIPTLIFAQNTWHHPMPNVRVISRWTDIREALAWALSVDDETTVLHRRAGLRMKRALDRVTLDPMKELTNGEEAGGAYLVERLVAAMAGVADADDAV